MLEHPRIQRYNGSLSEPLPRENPSGADNEQGRLTDLAWLAGLMDGEGWVGLIRARRPNRNYQRYTASMSFTTTSDRIAGRVHRILSDLDVRVGYRHREHYTGSDGSPRRPKWEIGTRSNKGTKVVLEAVLPYLTEKRVCAQLVLDYIEWRGAQPAKPGGNAQNIVRGMREKAEEVMADLRADRERSLPSTITRLAPLLAGDDMI